MAARLTASSHRRSPCSDEGVPLPDEAAVRVLRPDFEAIAALTLREEAREAIVTAAARPGRADALTGSAVPVLEARLRV
ncbi:hypothetical protein ACFY04_20135 [Streptomyces sp. NPDC001549]|uniref:hypothetical protein n=1 Tax=Streptomyces sp. NPDC001549 TaxID=3364586 RepID=UPI0036949A85